MFICQIFTEFPKYQYLAKRSFLEILDDAITLSSSWLLGDHLGSTSMVANASGTVVSEVRYSTFGEIRYQNGTLTTDYLYTGQRQEAEIGLYYFVARWYDPVIGRFIQADSIVPNPASAKSFDRYAYGYNNPLLYFDPSGHAPLLLDGMQTVYQDFSYSSHVSKENVENTNNWHEKPDKNVNFPDKNYNHKPKKPTSNSQNGCLPCLPETTELPAPPSGMPNFSPGQQPSHGVAPGCDYKCILQFMKGYLDSFNELAGAYDAATLLKTYKGAWKVGRASLPGGPYLEGGVSGLLHFAINYDNPNLSMGQNAGQSFAVALEVGITDVAASAVGLDIAVLGGTAGALTPIPVVDEAIGTGTGWLAGSLTTTFVLDSVFNRVNSSIFPVIGLGDYTP